ncbi:hypothetical protein [Chryseobacterium sp. EZn1]
MKKANKTKDEITKGQKDKIESSLPDCLGILLTRYQIKNPPKLTGSYIV